MTMPQQVRYLGRDPLVHQDRVRWGSNDDPEQYLKPGHTYTLWSREEHTWHTKYILVEFPGKKFNSTHFEDVEA